MVWDFLVNIIKGSCFGRFVRFWAGSERVLLFAFGRVGGGLKK